MASEHDSGVPISFFEAIVFAPLMVVGLLLLLVSWLSILDVVSWLSNKIRQYRARRGTDDALAQNVESGMVENRITENRVVENGPRRSEGAGSNTEELLVRPNAITEERVWWKMEL